MGQAKAVVPEDNLTQQSVDMQSQTAEPASTSAQPRRESHVKAVRLSQTDIRKIAQSSPFYNEAAKIVKGKLTETDASHRRQILNYCEHLRTAYTTKDMDYLFERQSGSWYLTGLTESETKAESTESTPAANVPEPMAESDVQDAILAAAGSDSASAEADSTAADEGVDTQAEEQPADSTEAQADESTASPAA